MKSVGLSRCDQLLTVAAGGGPQCTPRKRLRLRGNENLPRVDVLLPCCGEPVEVILDTVRAACTLDYPVSYFRVLVLDDGESRELHRAVNGLRSKWPHLFYHSRGKQSGRVFAKAGNLNYALFDLQGKGKVQPDYCAILDADSIPQPEFLRATLPHLLQNPQASLVTTRQYFDNLPTGDPLSQSRLHFYACQNAELDLRGCAIDAGSGAVFRRKTIVDDAGGYPTFSFSEDWQLSLILHGLGHRCVQVQEPLQFGLVPASLEGHIAQRNRWYIGHSQQVFALRPQTSKTLPRHIQWSIARGGFFMVLALVGNMLGYAAVPLLLTSGQLVPATSSLSVKIQAILALLQIAMMWIYGYLQNAHAGIRGSPFVHLENSWMAPGKMLASKSCFNEELLAKFMSEFFPAHLYAIIRFHFFSNRPKGSFVTGSTANSWNHLTIPPFYKKLYRNLRQGSVLQSILLLLATVGAMLYALTLALPDNPKSETLATRLLTSLAWPPLLHLIYLTVTNHWVPVAYILNPPHYPPRASVSVQDPTDEDKPSSPQEKHSELFTRHGHVHHLTTYHFLPLGTLVFVSLLMTSVFL